MVFVGRYVVPLIDFVVLVCAVGVFVAVIVIVVVEMISHLGYP